MLKIINQTFRSFVKLGIAEKFLLLLLVTINIRSLLDPDFGWHLRSGTDLLANFRVPKFDIYSHTLPDWPWVNHEWLTDGIVAFIYNDLGPFTLIILFALFIAGAFLLAASLEKVELKYKIVAGLIAVLAALPILGVRMQMVTLFGMALTLWILYRYRQKTLKHLWWFVPIFLLWTNLHGGFVIGLIILAVFFAAELAKFLVQYRWPKFYKKLHISENSLNTKQLKHLFIIGLLSGAVTLINPYGWGLYYDFYKLFTNSFALLGISEWQNVAILHPMSRNFAIYLILFLMVLALTYRKIEPTRWIITGLFLYLSFLYWRNMPFFMIMTVGFLAEIIQQHTSLVFGQITKYRWITTLIVVIVAVLTAQRIFDVVPKTLYPAINFQAGQYPYNAVDWIKNNPDQVGTTMFNEYDWGGFLIWQLPQQRVFIDGRMPFWQVDDRFVFYDCEYAMAAQPGSIEMLEDKYDVDWVLIRKNRPLAWALGGQESWQRIYSGDFAVIYRKINIDGENTVYEN